jgi:hypothetical protein
MLKVSPVFVKNRGGIVLEVGILAEIGTLGDLG